MSCPCALLFKLELEFGEVFLVNNPFNKLSLFFFTVFCGCTLIVTDFYFCSFCPSFYMVIFHFTSSSHALYIVTSSDNSLL